MHKKLKIALSAGGMLKREYKKVSKRCIELEDNLRDMADSLEALESRYALVCSAISTQNQYSDRYVAFRKLIDHRLLPLINRVTVVPNEAEQMVKIRAVDDELRVVESLKSFSERTVVAVAGGFSSGKSSFITSLFVNDDVQLPIGIEPVTAIPTYVFHAESPIINGYSPNGGCFQVPQQIYARLSHRFVEDFGFNLRDLLPFISLEVPMRTCRNLAFIDLPGYNPGVRGGSTEGDKSITDEYINQAQALIWMIGLDSNGTIPRDDLEHLLDLVANDLPLYVVLNKADLRPESTLDAVLDQVAEELEISGIPYIGICAYSSELGKEKAFRERSLFEVLVEWDKPRSLTQHILSKIEDVLTAYEKALMACVVAKKEGQALLKSLELNLLELGVFESKKSSGFDLNEYMDSGSKSSGSNAPWAEALKSAECSLLALEECQSSELIEKVKDQIISLKSDYNAKQFESDLEEVREIRSAFVALFE